MTPRDHDDARSDDQPVDRPEDLEMADEEAEPTVTRLSRADVRKYEQGIARASDYHPKPAQPEASDDDTDWHEVGGGAGSEEDEDEEPRAQATPPRDPAAGAGRSDGDPDSEATQGLDPLAALAAGGPDEKPTQILNRAEAPEDNRAAEAPEPPTVVSQGPLVGRRPGVASGNQDRTRVMAAPAAPSKDPGPGRGAAAATGAAVAGVAAATQPAEPDETAALAERRAEREARDRALGKRRPQPLAQVPVEPPSTRLPRTTDRFPASLGLFLAVAAVLGVRGAQQLMDIPGTINVFTGTALPYPEIFAWVTAVASVLIAVALVLGLLVRAAGLGTALVGIGALVYVYWWRSPFESGVYGFRGETELLLAGLGEFLRLVGGGAWGIDAAMRKSRLQRKAEKFEAEQV